MCNTAAGCNQPSIAVRPCGLFGDGVCESLEDLGNTAREPDFHRECSALCVVSVNHDRPVGDCCKKNKEV